jgi:hypothetical protein
MCMAKKPETTGPTFGGKSFFPTHAPEPIVALCRKSNFKLRAVEKTFRLAARRVLARDGSLNSDGVGKLFSARPVVALLKNEFNQTVATSVCIHRGTHVNTRHSQFTAPRPRDVRRAAMNGGAV